MVRSAFGVDAPSLSIALGAHSFDPGLPLLDGCSVEDLFGPAEATGVIGSVALFRAGQWLLGASSVPVTPATLEEQSFGLYRDLFKSCAGHHLARIWNYVPEINALGADGLENYRAFCRGRSMAFEREHGAGFTRYLPAASAVGCASIFRDMDT